jgi:hypothetical protein
VERFTDTAALFRALGGGWWNVRDRALLGSAAGVDAAPDTPLHNSTSSGSSHD